MILQEQLNHKNYLIREDGGN